MGVPSTVAGVNTNCFAAATAARSNAGPPDSTTATEATLPAPSIAIWRSTAAPLPALTSDGGNSASTNVVSFGGTITRCGWACAEPAIETPAIAA
jgi:hypothetical protein